MLRPIIGAAAAPLMPSFSSIKLWIVGSQITVVQIASNVPRAKSRPTNVLNRSCGGPKDLAGQLLRAGNATLLQNDDRGGGLLIADHQLGELLLRVAGIEFDQ